MKKKKILVLALLTIMLAIPITVIVEQDVDSIQEFTPTTLAIVLVAVSILAVVLSKKFKRRRRHNKSQTLPGLKGARVKLVSAWKCGECEEVFYLAGRISNETKPVRGATRRSNNT